MIKLGLRLAAFIITAMLSYSTHLQAQADEEPATFSPMVCEPEGNLDTCWQQASGLSETDPAKALFYYEQSCDFGQHPWGCYAAGKIYLHHSDLSDYAKAYQRFGTVCAGDDTGAGPYACKFMGWMHTAGVGAEKDSKIAGQLLSKACFSHNILTTDAEGCALLGDGFLKGQFNSIIKAEKIRETERSKYMAFLAYSRGCLGGARDVCITANELLAKEQDAKAGWIEVCSYLAPTGLMCGDLPVEGLSYEAKRKIERNLISQFAEFKHSYAIKY